MADVTARDRGRGQLILVGGIVVAIALVALVLLLNTVLFAENVASQGVDPGVDRAADYTTMAERAGARIVRIESGVEHESWEAARTSVEDDVGHVSDQSARRSLERHGATASIEVDDPSRGAVLVQNETGPFESTAGDGNWTLVSSTAGVRNFTTTVDASGTSTLADDGEPFTLRVETDADTWEAQVYDSGSNTVVVGVDGETCESNRSVATVNWTRGTLAGCRFPFATDGSGARLEGPYTIAYENGTRATGTYRLVVRDESSDDVESGNFAAAGSGDSPRRYPAVYDLVLAVAYGEAGADYETRVRVAPGEPEGMAP